jgi:hypothetical protein
MHYSSDPPSAAAALVKTQRAANLLRSPRGLLRSILLFWQRKIYNRIKNPVTRSCMDLRVPITKVILKRQTEEQGEETSGISLLGIIFYNAQKLMELALCSVV